MRPQEFAYDYFSGFSWDWCCSEERKQKLFLCKGKKQELLEHEKVSGMSTMPDLCLFVYNKQDQYIQKLRAGDDWDYTFFVLGAKL